MTYLQKVVAQAIAPGRCYTNDDLLRRIKTQTGVEPSIDELRKAANDLMHSGYLSCGKSNGIDIWSIKEPPKVSRAAVNTVACKVAKQF